MHAPHQGKEKEERIKFFKRLGESAREHKNARHFILGDFNSKIIATGTNEEKLNNLKKNFNNIHIEKFTLGEHNKIEEFINRWLLKLSRYFNID